MEREVVPELCNIMSEETRAVMWDMVSDLWTCSSEYWDFTIENKDYVTVGKGTNGENMAVDLSATKRKVQLWIETEVLEPYLVPEAQPQYDTKGRRTRKIQMGTNLFVHFVEKKGFWLHAFKPEKFADRRTILLNVMRFAQASRLVLMGVDGLDRSWYDLVGHPNVIELD